jgi:hypothetical protein
MSQGCRKDEEDSGSSNRVCERCARHARRRHELSVDHPVDVEEAADFVLELGALPTCSGSPAGRDLLDIHRPGRRIRASIDDARLGFMVRKCRLASPFSRWRCGGRFF